MVELGEAPVDEAELPFLVVDHHVVRLHVAVHDAVGVAELEGLEQLQDVVPDVHVRQRGVQHLNGWGRGMGGCVVYIDIDRGLGYRSYLEVDVVDVLEDEGGRLGLRVPHHVQQL